MTTRRGLTLGVAAAAGLAGAGWAWWRFQPHAVVDGEAERFWSLSFDGLQGQPVAMGAMRGRPLLVNFWATWCPPCVEELPLLNRFYNAHKAAGWQVLGLAIDQPSAVRRFLDKTPLDFPVVLAGLEGTGLSKALGNAQGGLPFTVVFDTSGAVAQRKIGQVKQPDLDTWLQGR
jgi:thiol-disulfide isomerase/thioredoxin